MGLPSMVAMMGRRQTHRSPKATDGPVRPVVVAATWMAAAAYAVGLEEIARPLGYAYACIRYGGHFPDVCDEQSFARLSYVAVGDSVLVHHGSRGGRVRIMRSSAKVFERFVVARLPRSFPTLLEAAQTYFEAFDPELVDGTSLAWDHWVRCAREIGVTQRIGHGLGGPPCNPYRVISWLSR